MTLAKLENAGPPWVIFAANGKPYAIMPAGRPGDVAIVKDLDPELVLRLVQCANQRSHDVETGIHRLTERLEAIQAKTESELVAGLRARVAELEAQLGSKCDCSGRVLEMFGHLRSCPSNPHYDVTPVYDLDTAACPRCGGDGEQLTELSLSGTCGCGTCRGSGRVKTDGSESPWTNERLAEKGLLKK